MATVAWWILALVAVAGAVTVLFARELMRVMLGLGVFLLGVAGLYAFYAVPFLAVSQVFVYVGGVLVLFLFAVTALRGDDVSGRALGRRADVDAGAAAIGVAVLLVLGLRQVADGMSDLPLRGVSVGATATTLLGKMLPHFEAVGVLLLAALVAALAAIGGGGERE